MPCDGGFVPARLVTSHCVFNMIRNTRTERGYIDEFRQGLTSKDVSFVVDQIFRTEIPRVDAMMHLNKLLFARNLELDAVRRGLRAAGDRLSDFVQEFVRLIDTGALYAK